MTEKKQRFIIEQTTIKECILDNTTGEQLDTFDYTERLCEVLNELHEENKQLSHDATVLICSNQEYRKENEQLKIQIDDVTNESIGYEEQIEKLLKKNERLQKERNHFERKKTEYLTEWNNCRIQNTELKKENKRLYEDNIRVKQLITETFNNERTELGQSVLKQLLDSI